MGSRKKQIGRIIMTILCVAAIGMIFFNSSLNADDSTGMSSPLVEGINRFLDSVHIDITVTEKAVRKAAHFTEYAILGALLSVTAWLYVNKRKETLVTALPLGCGVAVCDEIIQLFPKGRSFEIKDILIDCSGILFSVLIVQLILYIKEKRKAKKEGNESGRFIAE